MSLTEIMVERTLKPDGTLELDQQPSLPPGRVTVILRHGPRKINQRPVELAEETLKHRRSKCCPDSCGSPPNLNPVPAF